MRFILTGGSGLIGRALTESLCADGHETIILSRNPSSVRALPAGARAERWDGLTSDGWGHLAEGAQAIVNMAGESIAGDSTSSILFDRWTEGRKQRILESRLAAGRAVGMAVDEAERKPQVVIQASGVNFYGVGHDHPITEADRAGSDFLAKVCVAWEASTSSVEAQGVRRVVIRSGVVLAPSGGILPMMLLPFRLLVGGKLGNGRQWVPWIHLADEVACIRFLLSRSGASGPFNLTAPTLPHYSELAQMIGRTLHRPNWLPTPAFLLRALLGEKSTLVLEGDQVIPHRLQLLGFTFRFADPEAALRDLVS